MTFRTSEWVSPGHPDKVADGISEYILDKLLEFDPNVRYALEVQLKGNFVSLAGEITTSCDANEDDYKHFAKEAVNRIGYTKEYQEKWGKENTICGDDLNVICNISQQSPNIAEGVNNDGWGDQGVFTGYAELTNEHLMPLDKDLSREIGLKLYENVLNNKVGGLDIKTQVTLDDEKISQLVVAIPVKDEFELEEVKSFISFWLEVEKGINYLTDDQIIVNGTGIYKCHGPIADSGITGRKLAVDFYGNNAPIGGGCPWTKDGTKADLALNLFAREKAIEGLKFYEDNRFDINDKGYINPIPAHHAIYQLCSCIGKTNSFGTLKVFDKEDNLLYNVSVKIDVKPSELIEKYKLKEPIYFDMCEHGLWETDHVWNKP